MPPPDRNQELHVWKSCTSRDFTEFGQQARKHAYDVVKEEFKKTKSELTKDMQILRGRRQTESSCSGKGLNWFSNLIDRIHVYKGQGARDGLDSTLIIQCEFSPF